MLIGLRLARATVLVEYDLGRFAAGGSSGNLLAVYALTTGRLWAPVLLAVVLSSRLVYRW